MSILARSCKTHCMPSDPSTGLLERLCIRCGERLDPYKNYFSTVGEIVVVSV